MRVLKERHMKKWGYVIKDIEYTSEDGYGLDHPMVMKSAFTPEGLYIGDLRMAVILCKHRGIKPEYRTEDSNVCSIGFSEREGKWYGWSHRAIYGFQVGSTCTKGNCHYVPSTPQELYESVTTQDEDGWAWCEPDNVEMLANGVKITHKMVDVIPLEVATHDSDGNCIESPVDDTQLEVVEAEPSYQYLECGRGEWVADTMEDAKQMAKDFAESVS